MARHLAPFSCRQTMAEIVRRRSWGGVLPLGRHVSISGSSLIQCASVSMAPPHPGWAKCYPGAKVQGRTGPRWARRLPSDGMLWQPRADHEQKQELGNVTITRGRGATRAITEAPQSPSERLSDLLGHHDSAIMDGSDDGWLG